MIDSSSPAALPPAGTTHKEDTVEVCGCREQTASLKSHDEDDEDDEDNSWSFRDPVEDQTRPINSDVWCRCSSVLKACLCLSGQRVGSTF